MKKLLLFVLAAFAFAACEQTPIEEQSSVLQDAPETLTVGFEGNDTRIQLNEAQKTVWTKGDLVSVFYRSNANQQWKYDGETGARTANLKRVDAGTATRDMDRVVVVYPYNEDYYINPSTFNVQASLPATQTYLANSYGLDGNIMISSAEYNDVTLKNVCGWLKLQLTGDGEVVKSITFKGNNGEQVAGELYINSAEATAILASDMGNIAEDDGNNATGGAGANLSFDDVVLKEVTLDCYTGVTLGAEATAFYIALPPQTFEKGFVVEVNCSGYEPMIISTDNSISVERNHIQPMKAVEFEAEEQEFWFAFENISLEGTDCTVDIIPSNETLPYIVMSVDKAYIEGNSLENDEALFADDMAYFNWLGGLYGISALEVMNMRSKVGRDTVTISECTETFIIYAYYFDGETGELLGNIARYEYKIENNDVIEDELSVAIEVIDGVPHYVVEPRDDSAYWYIIGVSKSNYELLTSMYGSDEAILNEYFSRIDSESIIFYLHQGSEALPVNIKNDVTEYVYIACIVDINDNYAISNIVTGEFSTDNTPADIFEGDMPNNEIWYVTSDNTPVEVRNAHEFGATFVSNTYSSYGVVKFDGDVTKIANDAFSDVNVVQVRLPESLTAIGHSSFHGCGELNKVNLPNSITFIDGYSFAWCGNLKEITLPTSLKKIEYWAFVGCGFASVNVPEGVETIVSAFGGNLNLEKFEGVYASDDGRCLIMGNTLVDFAPANMTEYTIPNGPTKIDNWCFSTSLLQRVTIPNSVVEIGDRAFNGCEDLTSVTLSDNLEVCAGNAFDGCINLQEFIGTLTSEDKRCLVIGNELVAFARYGLSEYSVPEYITSIGGGVFQGCEIKYVKLHDNISSIGDFAFDGAHLEKIDIPDKVTSIGAYTFGYCRNAKEINLGKYTTVIRNMAFVECNNVTKIYIPATIQRIEWGALLSTTLKEVFCAATEPPYLEDDVFYGEMTNRKIYVPAASIAKYKSAEGWSSYKSELVAYDFENGVVVE